MFANHRDAWMTEADRNQVLRQTWEVAGSVVEVAPHAGAFQGWRIFTPPSPASPAPVDIGRSVIFDFDEHLVGKVTFTVEAPTGALLQATVAETPAELADPMDRYPGKLEVSWRPDPIIVAPGCQTIELPKRHALRFLRLDVVDARAPVWFHGVKLQASSAAGAALPSPKNPADPQLRQLDLVAMRTLRNCMQDVFEDGPKRDRRLWLGDLRLQALTAYQSFGAHALVRRCLYLLAACARPDGFVPACVFAKPTWHHGDEFIPDYALLLAPTVLDYAQASGDWETARNLWPLLLRQTELPATMMDADGLVRDRGNHWIFIDWCAELDRETALQGVFIYGLTQTVKLGQLLGIADSSLRPMQGTLQILRDSSARLWDAQQGCFISGPRRQVSWAAQVWMILAGVTAPDRGRQAMLHVMRHADAVAPQTPYLYHHVVDALNQCGLDAEAEHTMRHYWGGMLQRGASTFWEVFDPRDDRRSPYGSHLLNSYCHAWSCTPSWFIRRRGNRTSDANLIPTPATTRPQIPVASSPPQLTTCGVTRPGPRHHDPRTGAC